MKKISKLLVANRGEVAVRIIRAARELNITTVAIYATVDKDSLHVMLADEAICIGDYPLKDSYLNKEAIIQAAINTKCNAIHPGYGFLSENYEFAKLCEDINIEFIGPKSSTIKLMGDKETARKTMAAAKVPIVLGSDGLVADLDAAIKVGQKIGYPLIVKATLGGGGKGMRICYSEKELIANFDATKFEALNAFGNSDVYIEQYIENPRHIEVQIIADKFGNVRHLFERECSVQRNNQKLIEEAPVANIKAATKAALYTSATKAALDIGYESLGTIEYIMDSEENFYFIEMNTRLQVEHPISEMISGIDIVKTQIEIADGRALDFKQSDLKINGHAIELRVSAEDPYANFKANVGKINNLHFPGGFGVRIDSFIYPGYSVLPYYDSMLAKIIVHGKNRVETINKAIVALEEFDIEGITVNSEFLLEVMLNKKFIDNTYTTSLVKEMLK